MTDPDQIAEYVAVCVVHLRVYPCRHGEPGSECVVSIRPDEANIVMRYQRSEIEEREARMALDAIEWNGADS